MSRRPTVGHALFNGICHGGIAPKATEAREGPFPETAGATLSFFSP